MRKKYDSLSLDRMSRDPGKWRGAIYFNREDPRLIVPKWDSSMGSGYSFNCANPYFYILMIGILAIVFCNIYFGKYIIEFFKGILRT
jgi:uncharacterized membrane protein